MLLRPMKRIWPSLICMARANTSRHDLGLRKGSKPSMTNIKANAPSSVSHTVMMAATYFFGAAAGAAEPPPRMALKNSLDGSSTITSVLLRKVAR
jgi:hypothetical protein